MGSSTNTTTSATSLPADVQAALGTAVQRNLGASNMPYPMQGQPQPVAGFSDAQWYNLNQGDGSIANYQPQQVGTGYQPYQIGDGFPAMFNQTGYQSQTVNPGNVARYGSISGVGGIQDYMNPYTSQVIGTSMDELNRQLAQSQQATAGQAAQQGAFGGDRAAIMQSENARNANQIAAQTISGLNSQNYNQAAALSQQDASRNLQAGTAQSQLEANTGEANQYANLQAANLNATQDRANQAAWLGTNTLNAAQERANQAAYQSADQLNATQQRANQSAGLQGAQLNLSALGQQMNGLNLDQQTRQSMNNAQYANTQANNFWPQTQVTNLNQGLGTLAGIYPKTTTTTTPGPSTVGQLAGLGTAAAGVNSLTGGALTSGVKSLFGSSDPAATTFDAAGSNVGANTFDPTGFGSGVTAPDLSSGIGGFDTSGFASSLDGLSLARGGRVGCYDDGGAVDDTYAAVGGNGPAQQLQSALSANPAAIVQNGPRPLRMRPRVPKPGIRGFADGGDVSDDPQAYAMPGDEYGNLSPDAIAAIWRQRLHAANVPAPDAATIPAPDMASVPQPDPATVGPQPGLAPAGQPSLDNSDLVRRTAEQSLPPYDPQAGLAPAAQPDAGINVSGARPDDRVTRSADPGAPMPTPMLASSSLAPGLSGGSAATAPAATSQMAGPGAIPSQPAQPPQQGTSSQDDWTHNRTGMALLAAGLGMMASKSHTALGAIGEGGLAGVQQLRQTEDLRAAQMKNDLTQATMPSTLAALNGSLSGTGASDPGQAEVLRLRASAQRAQALGDGRTFATINEQLLQIAKDGRVTGADGRVYMVPNAAQLAFGHTEQQAAAGAAGTYPFEIGKQGNAAGLDILKTDQSQQGAAASEPPIVTTVADANGNPVQVSIPRLAQRQSALGARATQPNGQQNGVTPAQFTDMITGAENGGGNPAQRNASGPGGTPTSSAVGNGQFLTGTWLKLFKQSYPDAAGRLSDSQILALRENPQVSADMTQRYAAENGQTLARSGMPVNSATLALAHRFGPTGAIAVMNAAAAAPLGDVLGKGVVSANPDLRGVTAGQIQTRFASRFGTAPAPWATGDAQVQPAGFTQQAGQGGRGNVPQGLPPGAMPTGVPVLTKEQEAQSEGRAKQVTELDEKAAEASHTLGQLDVIQNSAPYFRPGLSGDTRAYASKAVTDLYQTLGLEPPDWAKNGATASDTIAKEGGYIAAGMTRMLGSREAASVFNQVRGITPNISLSNGGFQVIVNSLRQDAQRLVDMRDYKDAWLQDPSHHGTTVGMIQQFNKERPIETYASRVVPYPTPKSQDDAKPGVIYRLPNGGTAQWVEQPDGTKGFKPITMAQN